MLRFRCVWITLAALVWNAAGYARTDRVVETDSALKAYYKECRAKIRQPEALALCDTLFARAAQQDNKRMQVIALCTKLDYFYFRNDKENIRKYVAEVQDFCIENGKSDFYYFYYFVWSSRLITYYIKQNQSNSVMFEARKMLAEAQQDSYPQGMSECYRVLANLYLTQSSYKLAYDCFRREIEILENNNIGDINLVTQYASMAQCAIEMNMPDSADIILKKAAKLPKSPYQEFTFNKSLAQYHIHQKEYGAAEKLVAQSEALFRREKELAPYAQGLYYLKMEYARAVGRYDEALKIANSMVEDTTFMSSDYLIYEITRKRGDIYWEKGDMPAAAGNYRDYILASDSVRTRELQSSTSDLAGILEIGRLQTETKELQLDIQHRKLRNTYLIILSLTAFWLIGAVFFYRIFKLNRRLKRSEATVVTQNENLLAAGEELRAAKERAEHASRVKTSFIQNMSHEVRTPLNSIVGFSQILASQFRTDPQTVEFASIIESSSTTLLRLMDDMLDIAFLDQSEELPCTDSQDLNSCCQTSIDRILSQVRPGVALIFEPGTENPVIYTNPRRLSQVLTHLLHNAAKFTMDGQIVLAYTYSRAQKRVCFTVTDTGPGIPEDMQLEVFERFVKLDAFSQGTGLGLPICRIIAEKLGGSLTIDSSYTSGCRMIFDIPVEESRERIDRIF